MQFLELAAACSGWIVQRQAHSCLERIENISVSTLISRPADVGHRHQLLLRRRHIVLVVVKRPRLGFELLGLFIDRPRIRLDAGEFAAQLSSAILEIPFSARAWLM